MLTYFNQVQREEFRQLEKVSKLINRKLDGKVSVRVSFGGHREPLLRFMESKVGGRLAETKNILLTYKDLSLRALAEACRSGKAELAGRFRLPLSQAERLAEAGSSLIMELEEIELPPATSILLNVAPGGKGPEWKTLGALSTGQKATAILLLLLMESNSPLVLDQPEDDLDNRFISDTVVPKLRQEKRRRQFVFATHNANIPVLGDAELIAGLRAAGEASQGQAEIPVEHIGSIDNEPVRALVEEVLEGGRDAFETRRVKYGF